jgi:hypothetical protein
MEAESSEYSFAAVGVHLCNNEHPAAAYTVLRDFGWIGNFFSEKTGLTAPKNLSLHSQAD